MFFLCMRQYILSSQLWPVNECWSVDLLESWRLSVQRPRKWNMGNCLICFPSFFIIIISGCWHWKGAQRSNWVRLPSWMLKALLLVICRAVVEESCHRAALWGSEPGRPSPEGLAAQTGLLMCTAGPSHPVSFSAQAIPTPWVLTSFSLFRFPSFPGIILAH